MVREHGGDGEIVVPPTIHALLQARIDSLDGDVRVVMERGAVEGEVFHRGAVAELSPEAYAAASSRISRRSFARSSSARRRRRSLRTRGSDSGICSSATPRTSPCRRRQARNCTSASPAGWRRTSSSSATRSSATTSSRHTATAPSSIRLTPSSPCWRPRIASTWPTAGRGALDRGDFNAAGPLLRASGVLPAEISGATPSPRISCSLSSRSGDSCGEARSPR